MKERTKRQLQFYLTLLGLVMLTIIIGIFFTYLAFLAWKMKLGLPTGVKYELFATMAGILFLMTISDIFLFFHLVLRRKY